MVQLLEPVDSQPQAEPEGLYELINGQLLEKPMGALETLVGTRIGTRLVVFCEEHNIGQGLIEALFQLSGTDRARRPDAAVVTYSRWPQNRPIPERMNAWPVAPDLAVEVVSPSDTFVHVLAKVAEYFAADVRLVWLLVPSLHLAYVFNSPTDVRVLMASDDLTGEPVLPGFRVNLGRLFPLVEESPPPAPGS